MKAFPPPPQKVLVESTNVTRARALWVRAVADGRQQIEERTSHVELTKTVVRQALARIEKVDKAASSVLYTRVCGALVALCAAMCGGKVWLSRRRE